MQKKNNLAKELCHSQFQGANECYHHGILGMHWGEKNGPPYPLQSKINQRITNNALKLTEDQKRAIKNLRRARTSNLDKFGTSPDNNILFVSGYSGSGKSTTALGFKRAGDHVIHLDLYSELGAGNDKNRSKEFDAYLSTRVPNWTKIQNAQRNPKSGEVERYGKEYWSAVDAFRKAIEDFSKQEYKKGHRVIVEGVQISDDWLTEDRAYYKNKPVVILSTNPFVSMQRAAERDTGGNIFKRLHGLDDAKEYLGWYTHTNARLNELAKTSSAKRGQKYLKEITNKIGNMQIE